MTSTVSHVTTDAPARYARQLATHFSHKADVEDVGDGHRITIRGVPVDVTPADGLLVLSATSDDAEALATAQRVIGSHLERFGQRAGLEVSWQDVG